MSLQQAALAQPAEAAEWELASPDAGEMQSEPRPETPIVEEPVPAIPSGPTVEDIALEAGWTPREQWRGDPAKWTPAADYLRQMPRVLERTKQSVKQERSAVAELNARIARIEQGQHTIEQERGQALFEQYENAKFKAAQDGNNELYRKLTDEQQKALAPFRQAPPQAAPHEAEVYAHAEVIMQDPIAVRFFESNPLALQNEAAWVLVNREMSRVNATGGGAAAQFRAAEEALKYTYPDAYERPAFNGQVPSNQPHHSQEQARDPRGQFAQQTPPQQQRRPAPPMAAASRVSSANAGAASPVERLDADAKAFLDRQFQAGKVKDKDTWARVYLGEKPSITGARAQ